MRILQNYKLSTDLIGIRKGKHCILSEFEGKVLKIFTSYPQTELTDKSLAEFHWGDYEDENRPFKQWVRLPEATKIQNICWLHDLAPRVYEILGIELKCDFVYDGTHFQSGKYFAQLQDFETGDFITRKEDFEGVYEKVKELGDIYGFGVDRKDDVSGKDVIGDKLVDFNTMHFYDNHSDKVKAVIMEKAKYGKVYYQDEPELGMNGAPRKSEDRIKYMKLDEIDFKDKTVLDLGCAGGYFCRYAKSRGAKEVLGIDFEDVKGSDTRLAAYLISNELGYWDIDFRQMDLRIEQPPKADIVFFFSLDYHIGVPYWLGKATNEICIFEANTRGYKEDPSVLLETESKLKKMFSKVEFIGKAEDHGDKIIWKCIK
jgi:hypothetical protein